VAQDNWYRYRLVAKDEYEYEYGKFYDNDTPLEGNTAGPSTSTSNGISQLSAEVEKLRLQTLPSSNYVTANYADNYYPIMNSDNAFNAQDQYDQTQYEQNQDSVSYLPITLYGKNAKEIDVFANIDKESKDNWISLGCVNELALSFKKDKKAHRSHWVGSINKNLNSLGEISCTWSASTVGSKWVKAGFKVFKDPSPRTIFGKFYMDAKKIKASSSIAMISEISNLVPHEKYIRIKVLLIRWEDEGQLQCAAEVSDLRDTFFQRFRLDADVYLIPTDHSSSETTTHITRFDSGSVAGDLLIVYYAGHGSRSGITRRWLTLQQDHGFGGGTGEVPFHPINTILRDSPADVLLLMDCCFSRNAGRSQLPPATKILIAACDSRSETIGPGPNSFTSALIQVLQQTTTETFSAVRIHRAIKSIMRNRAELHRYDPDIIKLIHEPVLQHFSGRGDIKLVLMP